MAAPPVVTQKSSKGALAEVAEVVFLALALYLVITFAVQTVHVIGLSMYPTVDDQDYLIAAKLPYRLHSPERGDIIIMRDPFDSSKDFIKRVIALPGERLRIRAGKVYVNGRLLEEPYQAGSEPWIVNAEWPPPGSAAAGDPEGGLIPPKSYFVMGDNRNHSSDSRLFGAVKADQIEAKAWVRVIPVNHFGWIGGSPPRLQAQPGLPAAA